jgi:hypothetical protein
MTPDPYKASAGASDPGNWNRYAYVGGDPVNRVDRAGTCYGDVVESSEFDQCPPPDTGDCSYETFRDSGGCGGDASNVDVAWNGPVRGGDDGGCAPDVLLAFGSGSSPGTPCTTVPTSPVANVGCTLSLFERPIDALVGRALGGVHAYFYFQNLATGFSTIIEGINQTGKLRAQDNPTGSPSDDPKNNTLLGSITGSDVCNWRSLLDSGVARVNGANISYPPIGLGANSNSVARYLSTLLPNSSWFKVPPDLGFSEWYQLLPFEPHPFRMVGGRLPF